jgi:Fe-S-cluster containining protein
VDQIPARWIAEMRASGDAEVPCDGCTACCRSSRFVHVGPDEAAALAAIPGELLFAAPGWPAGWKVMGYDREGRCPMLGDDGCTIYEDRPRTCRTFDCRALAAAGMLKKLEEEAPAIAAAARRQAERSSSAIEASTPLTKRPDSSVE